jgi:3-keto-L-gulonate-6-phosphate decarboxylase
LTGIAGRIEKPISLAGGVNPEVIHQLNGLPINIFVVGGYLLNAEDKKQNAKLLFSELSQLNEGL